jgi:AcrR family transcriptional regulator
MAKRKPARLRLDTDERRTQLLDVGLRLFGDRAYDELSIDDLARAAKISKGLLYHYFPTKRDYYVASLRVAAERLLARVTDTDPFAAPIERLRAGLGRYLAYVNEHGAAYRALFRGGVGSDREVAAIVEETRLVVLGHLIAGMGLADPTRPPPILRLTLRAWIGAVEAASLDWVAEGDLPLEVVRDLLLEQLMLMVERAMKRIP